MRWQAHWIWLKNATAGTYTYAHARRTWHIAGAVDEASIAVSANHIYRLHVNGRRVGRGPDRADPRFPFYDTYDVRPHLKPGPNVIALDLYASADPEPGRSWCLYGGPPGLLLQLDYREDGQTKTLGTDGSWRMIESPAWRRDAPRISRFLGFVEHYDAQAARMIEGRCSPEFDDSAWPAPAVLGIPPGETPPPVGWRFAPSPRQEQAVDERTNAALRSLSSGATAARLPVDGAERHPTELRHPRSMGTPLSKEIPFLVPRAHLPLQIGRTVPDSGPAGSAMAHFGFRLEAPDRIVTTRPGIPAVLNLDFGRTMGGMIEVSLDNCCGGRLEIYYGEAEDRALAEIVELPDSGDLRFESMDWRGARHVTLMFHDLAQPVTLRSVRFIELEFPYADAGDFEADDPLPGRVWRMCRLTARVATKDHPQDCVSREQALWLSDLHVHARTAAVCFGDLRPFEKAYRQVLRIMTDEGVVAVPGPVAMGYHYTDPELPWSEQPLTLPIGIAHVYEYTGDQELPLFAAPYLPKLMARFRRYEDARGLLQVAAPGLQRLSVFTGWSGMLKEEGVPCNLNAEYVLSLRAAARILRVAGDESTARDYEDRASRVSRTLFDLFYSREHHLFMDGEKDGKLFERFSPTVNALCVLAGLLPRAEEGAWAHAMTTHPQLSEAGSPLDASMLLEAYFQVGRDDLARRLLEDCWGGFVAAGEPCVPEFWLRGHTSQMRCGHKGGSRCHPYGTAPAYCLPRYVLGISPLSPGYRKLAVAPLAMGLRTARGRMPTPAGEVEVCWRKSSDEWYLEITLPAGSVATVTLPRFGWGAGRMTCDGATVWEETGWRRFDDGNWRRPHSDLTDRVSAVVHGPGRHVVVMAAG